MIPTFNLCDRGGQAQKQWVSGQIWSEVAPTLSELGVLLTLIDKLAYCDLVQSWSK